MENYKQDTKQMIKEAALRLFSQKGYTAVSIRNICGEVGIKESTIYYHFKNKQEIFDELLTDFKVITSSVQNNFNMEFSKAVDIDKQSFILVGIAFLNKYLLNEKIQKLLRMLMIEQYVNENASNLLRQVLYETPLQQNQIIFGMMISKGIFKAHDVKVMAVEYYAPIFLTFQHYFSVNNVSDEIKAEANSMISTQLSNFYEKYYLKKSEDYSNESV